MPEIVEVRVVRDTLKKKILHEKIKSVQVLYDNIVVGDARAFEDLLKGKSIEDVESLGKWLIFNMGEYSVLSHLRMEGKYYYEDSKDPLEKHTHVVFHFEDGMELRYNDVRKFGRMEVVKSDEVMENASISKLGREPDDEGLTAEYLNESFKGKKKCIKSMLLDQTIINGLGNIYANEVLFASGISPFRLARDVNIKECEKIAEYAREITRKAYEEGGSTIRSYTSSLGVTGHYQDFLQVHGKEGEKCPKCGKPIKREKIEGRSAYYCEVCQK